MDYCEEEAVLDLICQYSPLSYYKLKLNYYSKQNMLNLVNEKLDLDLNRVHFVGGLPFNEYVNLLQITSAHVYLTYPFVASWSLLDAMSCGCPIVASSTEPVMLHQFFY